MNFCHISVRNFVLQVTAGHILNAVHAGIYTHKQFNNGVCTKLTAGQVTSSQNPASVHSTRFELHPPLNKSDIECDLLVQDDRGEIVYVTL